MKALESIFKKNLKADSKIKIEKLDKTKLEKVVGGTDTKGTTPTKDADWIPNTCAI